MEVRHYFDNFWKDETSTTVHKDQRRDDIVIALRSLNHDSAYNDNIFDIFKIYLRRAT